MNKLKKYLTKENITITIVLLIGAIISSVFMFKQVYNGIDTAYHMSRIIGITNSWKAGDLLAYIHVNTSGYGYAMGFFYSNLFMILPSILYMLGMNIILVYKIFILMCSIATAITMYICTKQISKSKYAATISAFLYTTCSYRIITLVVKAFVGEILSFIFIPLIILGLYQLIFGDSKKWWIFTIGFVGILNSNLVMTEIMIYISAVFVLCNIKKIIKDKGRLKGFIKATVLALLVSAMFWMPMIEQLIKSTFHMKDGMNMYRPTWWLLSFGDLFNGLMKLGTQITPAYGLGFIFIVIAILRLAIRNVDAQKLKFCDISILAGLVLLLCMTKFFPWKYLKTLGGMIQFPSRLEVPAAAFFSIASGMICHYLTEKKTILRRIIFGIIIIYQIGFVFMCIKSCEDALIEVELYRGLDSVYIDENFKYDICDGMYLPEGANVQSKLISHGRHEEKKDKYKTNNSECNFKYAKNGLKVNISFENNKETNTYVEVPIYYYYGYVAENPENNTKYKIEKGDEGVIRVYLENSESGTIQIYYKTTIVQKLSIIITIVTLLGIIICVKKSA